MKFQWDHSFYLRAFAPFQITSTIQNITCCFPSNLHMYDMHCAHTLWMRVTLIFTIRIAHAHFVYTIRVDELKMKSPKRIRNNEVQTIIFILFIDTDCTEKEKRKKVKRDRERQLKRDGFSQKWRRQWVSWCMFSHWIFLPIRMCLNILYFLSLSLQASSPFVCSLWIILMKLQASRPFGFRKNFVFTVSTFDSGIFETFFGVTASDTNEK